MVNRYLSLIGQDNQVNQDNHPRFSIINSPINLKEHKSLIIALCPGAAYGPAKKWQGFKKIAQELDKKDIAVWVFGSQQEQPDANDIVHDLQHTTNYTGKLTLSETIKRLSQVDMVISNDSGLMHIAAAVGTPLVALYGPSSPEYTPPLINQKVVLRKMDGYDKTRSGDLESGYHSSLLSIKPDEVMNALKGLWNS